MNVLNLEKMKAKLIKTPEQFYKLKFYNDEDMLACATALLSKQNCDEIFGITDVEKLAEEEFDKPYIVDMGTDITPAYQDGFKIGFNKAMELNKDKVFSKGDMAYIMNIMSIHELSFEDAIIKFQSIQQPTEIEVEIEMIKTPDAIFQFHDVPYSTPKLDSEGYLTLKKI